jgi:aspartate 1-decarboxylase
MSRGELTLEARVAALEAEVAELKRVVWSETTVDGEGRVLIPTSILDAAGIRPGDEVDVIAEAPGRALVRRRFLQGRRSR